MLIKGSGGSTTWGMSKSSFLVFLKGECQLPDVFTRSKNNYSMHVNFKRNFPKIDIFGKSSPTNFEIDP